jgi:hypothetical protein
MLNHLSVFELDAATHGNAYLVRIGGGLDSFAQPALQVARTSSSTVRGHLRRQAS